MALLDGSNAPTLLIEIDYGWRNIFTIGISPINSSTDVLGGTAGTNWQTIASTDARSVSIRRGRTREDQNFQPGQMTLVLDNRSGNYDPGNSSSTYIWNGYSVLTRGTKIRISATYGATTDYLFTGFIEQVTADQSLDPIATIIATDALAIFGANTLGTIASSYSGDTTSARIARVISDFSVGSYPGTFSTSLAGSRVMQPTTYGKTVLALCEEAAACEFGTFFVGTDGVANLIPYENLKTTTNQFTLSDARTAGTIEYDMIHTDPGARFMINSCILTQYSGHTQTVTNSIATARFGTYTRNVNAPLLNDSDALTMAGYYASRTQYPITRTDRVEFDALGLGSIWANVLPAEIGDRATVIRTTVDSRSINITNIIESISHDITPNSWRIGLDLSPSTF
jgi:hypothetical protein